MQLPLHDRSGASLRKVSDSPEQSLQPTELQPRAGESSADCHHAAGTHTYVGLPDPVCHPPAAYTLRGDLKARRP